jgi:aerobic carbon-monoxide dehydrogenase medium subunit
VIPAPFDYVRADDAESALAALREHGDEAKLLAGGQSLLPLMKLRLAMPTVVVDVSRAGELAYVREDGDVLAIGAMTRHCDLANDAAIAAHAPLLARAAGQVGDPQVRHRGTIGGSVAHADPSADIPTALLALDASYVVRGADGTRAVAAAEFSTGFLESVLAPDELLVEVRVPKATGQPWGYQKFTRRAIDWATVAVAVQARNGATAVALANMGSTVLRAAATEAALAAGSGAADAAAYADEGTAPAADVTASADYRRHLARVLTRRALEAATR